MSFDAFLPVADRMAIGVGDECELVERSAALQIAKNLDEQIAIQQVIWDQRDKDFATEMGVAFHRTVITTIPRSRIFTGQRPSLLESRWSDWPAITVRCNTSAPSSDREQPDQFDSLDLSLIVEVLARVGPIPVPSERDPEEAINRQCQRLSAAVHSCLRADPSIGGTTHFIKRPPRVRPSLPFSRKNSEGTGQESVYQAKELTYIVTKLSY